MEQATTISTAPGNTDYTGASTVHPGTSFASASHTPAAPPSRLPIHRYFCRL